MRDDHRVADALAMDIAQIVDQLCIAGLKRAGRELTGPCPQCGGNDRFSVNTSKRVFNCRRCGANGGNIDLVMFALGMTFPAALSWLCGERQELTAEQRRERERKAAENKRRNEERAQRERERSIAQAREIWVASKHAEGTAVRGYLEARGIPQALWPVLPPQLRFHPALPYMQQIGGQWVEVHRGPAMVAAMQGRDDRFRGVHRTWFDLDQPKGKAVILHPETGERLKVKLTLGSAKGSAIRLSEASPVLVMGEGIETTASALITGLPDGAAYWSGISLGNMGGQRQLGQGLKFAGVPDMTDADAFVPPHGTERLIFIQDGDSDPKLTRAKLLAGLRRAMILRPGLRAQIVHAGAGVDLNDVLLGNDPSADNQKGQSND